MTMIWLVEVSHILNFNLLTWLNDSDIEVQDVDAIPFAVITES